MSGLGGAIASISFCIVGGESLTFALHANAGTAVTFASTNSDIVPTPAPMTIPSQGVIQITVATQEVSEAAAVTITAANSATPTTDWVSLQVSVLPREQVEIPVDPMAPAS